MLILETLESAQTRNATIIAEMVGYGMSGTLPEVGEYAWSMDTLSTPPSHARPFTSLLTIRDLQAMRTTSHPPLRTAMGPTEP